MYKNCDKCLLLYNYLITFCHTLNKEIWCNTCKLKLLTKRLTYFTMFTIDVIMDFEFMSSYLTKKEVYYKVLDYIQNKYEYRKDLPEDYLVNTLMQEIYKPGEYYEEEE